MTSSDKLGFGKYRESSIKDVPLDYWQWLIKQDGFKDKQPALFEWITTKNEAALLKYTAPQPRPATSTSPAVATEQVSQDEQYLIGQSPQGFKSWWASAYGARLRSQGELHYIPYMRVALAAWAAGCETLYIDMQKMRQRIVDLENAGKPTEDF